jgi:high-affinity K+ transport system ATPase subunit B
VIKLDPRVQIRNPVMFVVELGAEITTVTCDRGGLGGQPRLRRRRRRLAARQRARRDRGPAGERG